MSPFSLPVKLGEFRQAKQVWRNGLFCALTQFASSNGFFPFVDFGEGRHWFKWASMSSSKLLKMKNQWYGRTVVCMGNGPSLEITDLNALESGYVIGTNRAFLLRKHFQTPHFHLLIQDNVRLGELAEQVRNLDCIKHFGSWYFNSDYPAPSWLDPRNQSVSVYLPRLEWERDLDQIRPVGSSKLGFSISPLDGLFYGSSVIFSAIQMAYYFGASKIVCIGIDMDFSKPNNFVPGFNVIWSGFDYETHAKPMFKLHRDFLANQGIDLINATPGGKVDVLKRESLRKALGMP